MTTSGTTAYDPGRNVLLNAALRIVGAYAVGHQPRPEQIDGALEALNMMLKGWQVDGFLWLRRFVRVKLVAAQNSYDIGVGSTDTVYVGETGTTAYAQRPVKINDPRRLDTDGNETPLIPLSRDRWAALPNKTNTGTVSHVYYDPQLVKGKLLVWPTPVTGVTDYVKFWTDRIVEDAGVDSDVTQDIPPEFQETVKYNLALRLSSEYPPGMSPEDKKLALALFEKMAGHQRDNASTFFQPGR